MGKFKSKWILKTFFLQGNLYFQYFKLIENAYSSKTLSLLMNHLIACSFTRYTIGLTNHNSYHTIITTFYCSVGVFLQSSIFEINTFIGPRLTLAVRNLLKISLIQLLEDDLLVFSSLIGWFLCQVSALSSLTQLSVVHITCISDLTAKTLSQSFDVCRYSYLMLGSTCGW